MGPTIHLFRFGATQCVIQVRVEAGTLEPWVATAVVVTDQPHALRWVGDRLGPLELLGATEAHALARMQAVLEERFGPRASQRPVPLWLFAVPIQPPNDDTSAVPVRLVWADASPDTLTSVPTRDSQLEIEVAGAGPDRIATFKLTEKRDSEFRWVYTQVLALIMHLACGR
jgi:hypothetical protein